MATPAYDPAKMVVSIVERGQGNHICHLWLDCGIPLHHQCIGHGTATSDMLDMLGLGSSEKDVLISIGPRSVVHRTLTELNESLGSAGRGKGKGIVFSLSLNAVSALAAATWAAGGKPSGQEEASMKTESKHSLILVTVNQGYTDDVMDTAKKAGATGGTVVRARWAGADHLEQFYGITLQTEKEIVAILAPNDIRGRIMEDINAKHGLKTKAQALLCSLAVDKAFKLT